MEDELNILESIFMHEIKINKSNRQIEYSIDINPSSGEIKNPISVCLHLSVTIDPCKYPELSPEIKIKNARGISENQIKCIYEDLKILCQEKQGEYIVYDIIEKTREILSQEVIPEGRCAICLDDFKTIETITRTKCFHFIHTTCLSTYFEFFIKNDEEFNNHDAKWKANSTELPCPICRDLTPYDNRGKVDVDVEPGVTQSRLTNECPAEASAIGAGDVFVPNTRQIREQKYRARIFKKQLKKGAIIDVEAERLKFLVVTSNHVQTVPPKVSGEDEEETVKPADIVFPSSSHRRNTGTHIRYSTRKK